MRIPCKDRYDERAGILQYDGGMSRYIAELTAAKAQGYSNSVLIKADFQTDANGLCLCEDCGFVVKYI